MDTIAESNAALVVRAPAKINLTLDVLGRRPDGYHELRSVMQTLELHDTLELRPAAGVEFACDAPALAGAGNLVPRAAHLLREAAGHTHAGGTGSGAGPFTRSGAGASGTGLVGYGGAAHAGAGSVVPLGAAITLRKRIPVDAGLGGGSSDAAATLLGLNEAWGLGLGTERLAALGAALGSDVPFFLHAPTALVSGRGEVVESLPPLPPTYVVLHKPPGGVSTARVFAALSPARYGEGSATARLLEALRGGLPPDAWPLSNSLQETVADLYPEVAAALGRLRACGAPQPVMTGSGSTVYALFAEEAAARRVYDCLTRAGHHAILTRTVASVGSQ